MATGSAVSARGAALAAAIARAPVAAAGVRQREHAIEVALRPELDGAVRDRLPAAATDLRVDRDRLALRRRAHAAEHLDRVARPPLHEQRQPERVVHAGLLRAAARAQPGLEAAGARLVVDQRILR